VSRAFVENNLATAHAGHPSSHFRLPNPRVFLRVRVLALFISISKHEYVHFG
jgi:hypothetical protein